MEKQDERSIVREEDVSSDFYAHKPENVTDENWEFEHQQVCGYIWKWVEYNVHSHIVNETHAKTLWEKFETL